MKLDSHIILIDHAQIAEVGTRRLGKYQVLGSWNTSIGAKDFATTMTRTIDTRPCAPLAPSDADWGEQDNGGRLRYSPPTSIRLAINPTLAPEGDE